MAYFPREKANEWIQRMFDEYSIETAESVVSTSVVQTIINEKEFRPQNLPRVIIEDMTTDAAIHYYSKDRETCALNFASYTNVGGSMSSSKPQVHVAQEEALCLKSNLFNIISQDDFKEFYEYNRKHTNNHLYENRALYSPEVVFPTEPYGEDFCNILTCAAPNLTAFCGTSSNESYLRVLNSRCKFILDAMALKGNRTIILGAFGCGVFKNDPTTVANTFKELLLKYDYGFETVIFAIPKGDNLDAFVKVFSDFNQQTV